MFAETMATKQIPTSAPLTRRSVMQQLLAARPHPNVILAGFQHLGAVLLRVCVCLQRVFVCCSRSPCAQPRTVSWPRDGTET